MNTFMKYALLTLGIAGIGVFGVFGVRRIRSRHHFSKTQ